MKSITPKLIILFIIILIYSYYGVFPYIVFSHNNKYKSIDINSDASFDKHKLNTLLDSVIYRLNDKSVFLKNHDYNVFICNNPINLRIFTFKLGSPFGLNQNVNGRIFINKSNIDSNLVFTRNLKNNRRTFTSVLVHEFTHSYLYEKLGYFKFYYSLDTWKNEGFCEYVAGETSFPQKEGIGLIINNKKDNSYSFKYFIYYQRVKYLLDVKKEPIDIFLEKDYDEEKIDNEIKQWLLENKN